MRMFRRLLLLEFIPFFFLGVFFFSLVLLLADVFAGLWQYLNRNVPFSQAIQVSLLYAPKAIAYSLPIGTMFAAAFSLGNLASRNEMIGIHGSGVSLIRFILPILFIALLVSIGGYFWEDRFAVPLLRERNVLSKELLGIRETKDRSKAVVLSLDGQVVYYANYYNDKQKVLTGVTLLLLNEEKELQKRIDADQGVWDNATQAWILKSCRVYTEVEGNEIVQEIHTQYTDERLNAAPETFRLDTREVEEMNDREARAWIASQRGSGLPYRAQQAQLYQRYTIALTPFLVVLFAGSLSGRFQRNILLMSLLTTLLLSAGWYIVRMISTLLSELGMISPLLGAVLPYVGFLIFGGWLFTHAKT